jgi:ArsR family transcriptional regulator
MISTLYETASNRQPSGVTASRDEEGTALDIPALSAAVSERMVQLFKLLADETRLQILYFLTQRHELNVGTLCDLLQQSQPAVSHHLALLRLAGLIEMRREGKHNYYRLQPAKFQESAQLVYSVLPAEARNWTEATVAPAPAPAPAAPANTATPGSSGV